MTRIWGAILIGLAMLWPSLAVAAPSQPVIVVPGIVGSRLCEAGANGRPGEQLWGAGLLYLGRLSQLALPIQAGEPERAVVPCGLLDSFSVLGPFDVDVYSGLIEFLKSTGYREGVDLFILDYDWRRSNFETAERLRAKVAEVKAKTGKAKVAIVAHSMGGIATRAYLQTMNGAADAETVVFFGTPHQGAAQVLRTAESGWGVLPNWIVGGEDVIRETMFTWPSIYELLNLERCCAISQSASRAEAVSLSRADRWARFGWLPAKFKTATGQSFMQRAIAASQRARAVLDAPLPEGPNYTLVASRAHKTTERVVFSSDYAMVARYLVGPGDETVPILSAANGMITRAFLVPRPHTTLYDDDFARYVLARALKLDVPALKAKFEGGAGGRVLRFDRSSNASEACEGLTAAEKNAAAEGGAQAVLIDDAGKAVCIWAFDLDAPRAVQTGSDVVVSLRLGGYSASFWRALTPTVKVMGEDGKTAAEYNPASAYASNAEGRFAANYRFTFKAPSKPGVYRFDLSQDGLSDRAACVYVVVYGPQSAAR